MLRSFARATPARVKHNARGQAQRPLGRLTTTPRSCFPIGSPPTSSQSEAHVANHAIDISSKLSPNGLMDWVSSIQSVALLLQAAAIAHYDDNDYNYYDYYDDDDDYYYHDDDWHYDDCYYEYYQRKYYEYEYE